MKYENLQTTGSFKIRGAAEALTRLIKSGSKPTKVIAASAGNHGAGLAYAGHGYGIQVELFVPESTPIGKCQKMEAYGAILQKCAGGYDESESLAKKAAQQQGVPYISPYDDDAVIHGNGYLLGKEIEKDLRGVKTVLAPLGGGGMASGLGKYFQSRGVRVIGVSPKNNCAMVTSFETGMAQTDYKGLPTMAEGLEGSVSEKTFDLCKRYGIETFTVSEQAIQNAMVFSYLHLAQELEASAAVVIAAYLDERLNIEKDCDHVLILSGGNVDAATLSKILQDR